MQVRKSRIADGLHLSCGIQLHGAGAQGNHSGIEREITGLQSVQITHHPRLGMIGVENWMSQVFTLPKVAQFSCTF